MNKIPSRVVSRWLQACLAFLLLAVTLVLPVGSVQAAQRDVPRFEPAPCMVELPPGAGQGGRVECGYLVVPEQYSDPDGPTIRLAVVIIRSEADNPAPDPFVVMQGGPGGSTIDDYSLALFSTPRILPNINRDLILFDQRGTLYSEPYLGCSEVDQLTLDTLDDDLSKAEYNQRYLDALSQCRERLQAEGVNLSAFDTYENAADVESLRLALGYDQINLYGVSYGTLLALNVMREFPQGLRSVIIDSVVPPQENFLTQVVQSELRSFRKLFDSCAADPECNAAFPNLETVFYEQVDRLNENPARIQLTDISTGQVYPALLNGDDLIVSIFRMLYSTDFIPLLPQVIYDARAGKFDVIERFLSLVELNFSSSTGMYFSVICAEDADYNADEIDMTGAPPQILEMEEGNGELILSVCQLWDVDPLGSSADEPVVSDVPTLVLSGEFDPITPPAFAQMAAESLSNSYSVTFPAGGHGAMLNGECQDSIILQFLDNPNQAPDTTCLADTPSPEFLTPSSIIDLPVLPKLLNLQGSSGIEMSLFALGLLFLLTAFLVYPIVWLVRLLTNRSKAAAPPSPQPGLAGYEQTPYQVVGEPVQEQRPRSWRLAPWLAVAVAALLLIFSIVLVSIVVNMVVQNDIRFLVGLPASAAPLFIIPPLAVLLVVIMVVLLVMAWTRRWGSVWGRLYFSLLTLSALLVVGVLGRWGMLFALVTG